MRTTPQGQVFQVRFLLTQDNEVVSLAEGTNVEITFTKEGASSPSASFSLGTDPYLARQELSAGEERGEGILFQASPAQIGLSVGQYVYQWTVSGEHTATQEGRIEVTPGAAHQTLEYFEKVKRRVARLAQRTNDPILLPTKSDHSLLRDYLKEALHEISTQTDRMEGRVTVTLDEGEAAVAMPQEVHTILDADVRDETNASRLSMGHGPTTARKVREPDPKTGRPCTIGQQGRKLFFLPVPDKQYEVDLYVEFSGEPPSDGTLAEVVGRIPPELRRAVVYYLVSQWLNYDGHPGMGDSFMQKYQRDLLQHSDKSNTQSVGEVKYKPLGFG